MKPTFIAHSLLFSTLLLNLSLTGCGTTPATQPSPAPSASTTAVTAINTLNPASTEEMDSQVLDDIFNVMGLEGETPATGADKVRQHQKHWNKLKTSDPELATKLADLKALSPAERKAKLQDMKPSFGKRPFKQDNLAPEERKAKAEAFKASHPDGKHPGGAFGPEMKAQMDAFKNLTAEERKAKFESFKASHPQFKNQKSR